MTTYVGARLKRLEDPDLVTGAGNFVDDVQLPGMLHAAVLRSPHPHAIIRSIDVSEAAALPGVMVVATADDLLDLEPDFPMQPGLAGVTMTPPAHPLLARGRVRYVGDAVAVAVAETLYQARDALDLVKVDYEPLTAVVDPDTALKDEVVLHEELGTNIVYKMDERHGDLEDVFLRAHRVIRGSFKSQRLCPSPMETRGVVASYDRDADLLTVWNATQAPHRDRGDIARILHRDPNSIRVIAPDVGGGFGGKNVRPDMAVVCHYAIKLGRPIKCIEDRGENMTFYHARDMACDMEVAVASDGAMLGLRARTVCDLGAYFIKPTPTPPHIMALCFPGPFSVPVVHVELKGVVTNKPTTGPYRGAGGPEAAYFMERTISLIADELGLDPMDVRRRNLIPADDMPHSTALGANYEEGDFGALLDRALELADYHDLRNDQARARAEGRLVGIGVASFIEKTGGGGDFMNSNARVEIAADGHVTVYTEASPHGQGGETTYAQIAADVLGVSPEQVSVLHGDTDMLEVGYGTLASRGVILSGSAVYLALQEARENISLIAADLFGCPAADVEYGEGLVFHRGGSNSASFAEVAARAFQEETLPDGVSPGLEFTSDFKLPDYCYPLGTHVMSVEVDRDTGEVKLLRCVCVHDCGRIINPKLLEGQQHGGLAQGIGQALTEQVVYTADGQPLTGGFLDYGMPTAEDMPEVVLENHETLSTRNPLGARGGSEISTFGPTSTVAHAVADALSPLQTGHLETPFTPEKVWRVIQAGRDSGGR